jgi:hypothetical protein
MSDGRRMHDLLSALRRGDERGEIMSSDVLATDLGWNPAAVAATARDMKAAMFIWGARSGGTPQPHFDEIEVTVHGNRQLRAAPATV